MDAMKRKIESWYFRERVPLFSLYDTIVENETKVASIILDVGAGRRPHTNRAIAMDVSESELKANISSAAKVVAAAEHLPFRKECIELLTCSSVLEHLISPKAFFSEAAGVLKPGGRLVALFSCRFAPFAILNRFLPHALIVSLLHHFVENPGTGFPAYYTDCYPSRMRQILAETDLQIEDIHLNYYQSEYYIFFMPLYLLSLLFDLFLTWLNRENLCSHMLIVARKPQVSAGNKNTEREALMQLPEPQTTMKDA